MMPRIMAMTPGKNGMLYGRCGSLPGYAHLFSYLRQKGFRDLGNPEFKMITPGLEQGINAARIPDRFNGNFTEW